MVGRTARTLGYLAAVVVGWCVAFAAIFVAAAVYAEAVTGVPPASCVLHPVDPMPMSTFPLTLASAMGATFLVALYHALGAQSVRRRVGGIVLAIAVAAASAVPTLLVVALMPGCP